VKAINTKKKNLENIATCSRP